MAPRATEGDEKPACGEEEANELERRDRLLNRAEGLAALSKLKPGDSPEETKVTSAPSDFFLLSSSATLRLRGEKCLRRIAALTGAPIRIEYTPELRDHRGEVHAGSFLRERRIAFNCTRAEFPRIFVHELFHFIWLRAGNPLRHSWESLLRAELAAHARGELGWSAEWRKGAVETADSTRRTRRWREYCCESFCDTAAWLYSGMRHHSEFTLAARFRARRRVWFGTAVGNRQLPV